MSDEMNLTGKLLSRSVLERIEALDWSGDSDVGPYVVELDPTAACDLACPGCISEDIIAEGGRFSNSRLLNLVGEFSECGIKAVILIGGGEPLTHPKTSEFIELCGDNDIHVGITTNGTLIHKHINAIARHASWTRVSMDAGSQDLFDKLRPSKSGRSAFRQVISNMENLARVKTGLLGYSYLLQSPADGESVVENLDDLYVAAHLAREIGCDYFEVKPSYAWRGDIPHSLMVHDPAFLKEAVARVAQLDELESDSFHILHAINLKHSLAGVQALQLKDYTSCPSASLRTLVTPKGVYVCPYWRGKSAFKLGDLEQQSFTDLWKSDAKKQVLGNLDPSAQCNFHCLRHDTNITAFDIKEKMARGDVSNDGVVDERRVDRFI